MITKISTSLKFLNKPIRVISSLVIAIGMVFSSMPFVDFNVKADNEPTGTYYTYEAGECFSYALSNGRYSRFNANDTCRLVYIKSESGAYYYLFMVLYEKPGGFKYDTTQTGQVAACNMNVNMTTTTGYTFDGHTYQMRAIQQNGYYFNDIPLHVVNSNGQGEANLAEYAYNFTYGSGSSSANPVIEYGTLKDLTFSSSVVGSGNGTGEANKDTITWYPYVDSNNKSFGSGGSVEIRVVPGDYESGTQEGIFTQTYSDFILDVAHAGHLATVPAYNGTYTVNWGTVMQKLSASWPALELLWDGEYWKKLGWVYQVRYQFEEDENTDNWSDWQTVYTITSSTPSGTDGLDPTDGTAMPGFYENVVDAFNTTSVVNNNSNVTYYVNNIQYTVNETPETPGSDVTNDLLREIRNITIQIRQLIVDQNNDGDEKDPEDTGLNDKDKELHDKEKELIDDMDDKLNDIDTDVDLLDTNGFLAAANWVRLQYDHLTLNTPFELVIVFALVLGIGLIFIGKVR